MHWVSLFVELLRTRPRAVFWAAALTQTAIWTLVPSLFYSAPPGEIAEFMAVAREWGLGTPFGPPLAYWLAEIAFRALGMPGVYLLSQACMLVALWAVFSLGCIVVGAPQAAMAVLLMAGIAAFGVPTPEFGPPMLAMALWALMLLHYWQAAGQGKRLYWIGVGIEAGLLVLTAYTGFILIGLLLAFAAATRRGREQLSSVEPLIAGAIVVLVLLPHMVWVEQTNLLASVRLASGAEIVANSAAWMRTVGVLLAGHLGLIVLVLFSRGFSLSPRGAPAEITRAPTDPDGRWFVLFFAVAPIVAVGLVSLFSGRADNFVAPALVILSGLAVIVAAPDRIGIVHQRIAQYVWAMLLLMPPLLVVLTLLLLPWTLAVELRTALPSAEMGRFFAENFERRTGRPLAIVTGDTRTAALVALTAPSRPSLYRLDAPELSPAVTRKDIDVKGAVVVWPTVTTRGIPPASIQQHLTGLIAEVPRAFERRIQGRLPLYRVGWSAIRPAGQSPARQ